MYHIQMFAFCFKTGDERESFISMYLKKKKKKKQNPNLNLKELMES